ncbi:cytochrome-c oxidase, cbb3-type subunit II [Aurantiacibacter sp. D1-12]|uniref:cytochrome-c oxidase, cbb3-type subunit II n=1 Tax=Aurantiacibacter sp. D1-12 TaxID=2993658 RepID=UPI00237CBFF8|nr:cytochrome-c oxidase, cbb3-type subunit II [Aurantiacibacter sp. D1-12]MDE1467750.1 cytochrome-c oxidase, cbb3-type subunit II [Aurantiacibacter sp. D1-12]
MSMTERHKKLERNITLLAVCTFITVAIGGLVQITPLFYLDNTIEEVDGMRPYTPLELAGRDIYVREGCYVCHSQMIRPFRDEIERYGHYSLAAESMYDRPFQWGSKRTGPDLARVGGRYSDEWHVQHLINPQAVVPESIMPTYAFLADTTLNVNDPSANLATLQTLGVPYTDEDVTQAMADLILQGSEFPGAGLADFNARYPNAQARDFDGDPDRLTEMDALVAYLQMLGTLVDVDSAAAQQELAEELGR